MKCVLILTYRRRISRQSCIIIIAYKLHISVKSLPVPLLKEIDDSTLIAMNVAAMQRETPYNFIGTSVSLTDSVAGMQCV